MSDSVTPWTAACQASLSIINSGIYPNSGPLSRWCHPTFSSSVVPFSSCPQSFPALGSFPMSQFFTSGGQSIGVSASASVLPVNIQDWFPLGWTGLIALQSKELSRVFSNTTVRKHQFFPLRLYDPTFTSVLDYLKNHSFDSMDLVGKVMSLLFHMLSRFVTVFLPRSKRLNFMAAVTICNDFTAQENKVCHCFHCFPIYLAWRDGTGCCDLRFLTVEF